MILLFLAWATLEFFAHDPAFSTSVQSTLYDTDLSWQSFSQADWERKD